MKVARVTSEERMLLFDLRDRGIALDGEVLRNLDVGVPKLEIFQNDLVSNSVFDLDRGGTGYLLDIAVENSSTKPIRLNEFRLEIPWHEPHFRWLPRPPKKCIYGYSFPSPGVQGLDPEVVLNHRIGSRINPGGFLDGFLLGIGKASIPDSYSDRTLVKMRLSIFDGRGDSYCVELKIPISRKANGTRRKSDAKPRAPLFSKDELRDAA